METDPNRTVPRRTVLVEMRHKSASQPAIAVSLDNEKAFDLVEWQYLFRVWIWP